MPPGSARPTPCWRRPASDSGTVVDVVVAYVESHGRSRDRCPAGRAGGAAPRPRSSTRGCCCRRLDLDAVLARQPADRPGGRAGPQQCPRLAPRKALAGCEELLAAGIDVYTTVNVQHFESLNDVVAQITGVVVRETVPDRLLDLAAEGTCLKRPTLRRWIWITTRT